MKAESEPQEAAGAEDPIRYPAATVREPRVGYPYS
jgi:hypothetical protein